jgi:hypothetical protein
MLHHSVDLLGSDQNMHEQYQSLRKERLTYLDANILASTDLEQLMPLETDDEHIHEYTVQAQLADVLSVVVGFNAGSHVFSIALRPPAEKVEDCCCERPRSSAAQFHHSYLRSTHSNAAFHQPRLVIA